MKRSWLRFALGLLCPEPGGEEQSEGCPPHPPRTFQPGLLFQKVIGISNGSLDTFP